MGDGAIEMVVCSFALHLVEKQSELFALLWELRCVARVSAFRAAAVCLRRRAMYEADGGLAPTARRRDGLSSSRRISAPR